MICDWTFLFFYRTITCSVACRSWVAACVCVEGTNRWSTLWTPAPVWQLCQRSSSPAPRWNACSSLWRHGVRVTISRYRTGIEHRTPFTLNNPSAATLILLRVQQVSNDRIIIHFYCTGTAETHVWGTCDEADLVVRYRMLHVYTCIRYGGVVDI